MRRANLHFIEAASQALAPHDITPLQWSALARIEANAGCNQSELGSALAINRSGAAKVVTRLVELGLACRLKTSDPRAYALEITPTGQEILAKAGAAIRGSEREILSVLDESERRELSRLLLKLERPPRKTTRDSREEGRRTRGGSTGENAENSLKSKPSR